MMKHDIQFGSWHMWLANFGIDPYVKLRKGSTIDICSYIRMVWTGFFKLAGIVLLITAAVGWTLFSIGNLIGWLFYGYLLEVVTIFNIILLLVFFGLFVAFAISHACKEYQLDKYWKTIYRKGKKPEPGFIVLAYRKFKEKTCFVLEIK
jgi:hypothetical protein